tara:strand:- start:43 stop:252 length:210 start_codon:yes stop_codon:yes gene_type:complete
VPIFYQVHGTGDFYALMLREQSLLHGTVTVTLQYGMDAGPQKFPHLITNVGGKEIFILFPQTSDLRGLE